jgi:peptidyl-tRNA hydrolase
MSGPWEAPAGFDNPDPDGEAPWAMQLVVRVEKASPPSERAACSAAARAVVELLTDERARPGGPWAPLVERWSRGRIRKVVRRARAHAWEKAQSVEGVTATVDGAEVRALVPGPTDAVPLEISRLQIRGLDLDGGDQVADVHPDEVSPGIVIGLAPLEGSSTGKRAAAAGHAAQLALAAMGPARRRRWAEGGFDALVTHPDADRWAELRATAPVVVADAGFTEVEPGTVTAVASWS